MTSWPTQCPPIPRGTRIQSRDGNESGVATGGWQPCRLEDCVGRRWAVRWSDGELTYLCEVALEPVTPLTQLAQAAGPLGACVYRLI